MDNTESIFSKPIPRADGEHAEDYFGPAPLNSWLDYTARLRRPMIAHYDVSSINYNDNVESVMDQARLIKYCPVRDLTSAFRPDGTAITPRLRLPRGFYPVRITPVNTKRYYCLAVLCYPRQSIPVTPDTPKTPNKRSTK